MTDIHDIKPILDMGADWHWLIWAAIVLAAVVAVLLAWWYWRRRRKKGEIPVEAPLPAAEEEAYALLDQLAADREVDGKLFYFRLSAIMRRYVERRFAFPAAQMTVEELLPWVTRLPLPQDLARPFNDLCRRAEPIKFAGVAAADHQRDQDLNFVREFVRHTALVEASTPDRSDATSDQPWADRISAAQPSKPTIAERNTQITE